LAWIVLFAVSAAESAVIGKESGPGSASRPVLPLSLKQSVDIALSPHGNIRSQLTREMINQAGARSGQARAVLLPNLEASVKGQRQVRSLAAYGMQLNSSIPGLSFPETVGPYNTIDFRVTLSQQIFNLSAIRRFQAARKNLNAFEAEHERAGDQVAAETATAYLEALRSDADVTVARANTELSEALLQMARNKKEAGTGTGIDVTRAQVQLSNERQRLLAMENERRKAYFRLLKTMGMTYDIDLTLTETLGIPPMEEIKETQAVAVAFALRRDLKAQQLRGEGARLNYSAARADRIPALVGFSDYGAIGTTMDDAEPTWTVGLAVNVPLFEGGRRDARRAENRSLWHQEKLKQDDLKKKIELEIRLALADRQSSYEQVHVAEKGLDLAQHELAQARRRYQTGITGSLEVTDAQTRLARARDNRTMAFFNYNMARIKLARALGTIRPLIGYHASILGN
jgi:outer membrane protein TolC